MTSVSSAARACFLPLLFVSSVFASNAVAAKVDYIQTLKNGDSVLYRVDSEKRGNDAIFTRGKTGSNEWIPVRTGLTFRVFDVDKEYKDTYAREGISVWGYGKSSQDSSHYRLVGEEGINFILSHDAYGLIPHETWQEIELKRVSLGDAVYLFISLEINSERSATYVVRVSDGKRILLGSVYSKISSPGKIHLLDGSFFIKDLNVSFNPNAFDGKSPDISVNENGMQFSITKDASEITVQDSNGRKIRFPGEEDISNASVSVEDGILSIKGAERSVDLRAFDGEVDLIGDTFPIVGFLDGDKKAYPIKETIEAAAPDLVARARTNLKNGEAIALEATKSETAPKVIGTLFEKQSVKIVGEAGSGKTSEIELLAEEIAAGKIKGVPRTLKIRELSLGLFSSGTEYVGMAAMKGNALLAYAEAYKPIFLVDEFHQITNTGVSSSGGGLAEQIKPQLERGKIRFIAVSTTAEWNRAFKSNPALNQRFDEVVHEAPTDDELLKRLRNSLRRQGKRLLDDPILRRAIELSGRFSISGSQPRIAVNLLKKASSILRQGGEFHAELTVQSVENAAVQSYRIDPVFFSRESAFHLVQGLGDRIRKKIVGQAASIDAIEETALRMMSGVGLDGAANVIGYYGPPGTGKTLSSKLLAQEMKMNTGLIAMSAYGNGDVDAFRYQIYEILEKSPMSVIIIDEVNRAPEKVQNALLDMINEKKFTVDFKTPNGDHFFREVRCPNAIFVWTTNAGQELITPAETGMRPVDPLKIPRGTVDTALTKGGVVEALLSRTPTVVGMPRPSQVEFQKALERQVDDLLLREGAKNGIRIRLAKQSEFVKYVMNDFEEHISDYRGVPAILQKELEPWIARALLNPEVEKSKRVILDWQPNLEVAARKRCLMTLHFKPELPLRSLPRN